jgi:hypothetical protein
LEAALQSIVTVHPEGANLCLDAGYAGSRALVEELGLKRISVDEGKKK